MDKQQSYSYVPLYTLNVDDIIKCYLRKDNSILEAAAQK